MATLLLDMSDCDVLRHHDSRTIRASFKWGRGGALAPLDILLPPLSYHAMCLHTQTYVPSPPHPHKTLFCPLLSHFLDEGLIMTYHDCKNYHDCHILQTFGTNKQAVVHNIS